MKIALRWLNEYLPLQAPVEDIANKLTLSGLEVEGIHPYETIPGNLEGVIVAQVVECEKHPNADKLKKCKVDTGKEIVEVICGAPNVAVNQKVMFATIGTTLYPSHQEPITIKPAKIRGELSNGMICSESELSLAEHSDGIMVLPEDAPIGMPAKEYFELVHDTILEIGVTPNRTDALSHFGVARELAALYRLPIHFPVQELEPSFECPVTVTVEAPEACPLYAGLVIRNLKVQDSPKWLKEKLLSIGQKPINNVVDVTNYILLGLGQPLHAFDLKTISQQHIIVRKSRPGELLVALDKTSVTFTGEELLITSPEQPLCIAGLMGGLHSGVTQHTTDIFLEAAYFSPQQVRRSAQKTGLHSESAYRFERGIDPNRVIDCLKIAANLIQTLAGGEISTIVHQGTTHFEPYSVPFHYHKANQLIGAQIPVSTYHEIFQALEFQIEPVNEQQVNLLVPRYRHDVTRFQDVVEEFLRIYGLNRIPTPGQVQIPAYSLRTFSDHSIRWDLGNDLAGKGWREIETNSFVNEKWATHRTVRILNKLSEEHAHLRETLLWNGLNAIQYNLFRQNYDLKFFEWGKVYLHHPEKPIEKTELAFWLTGKRFPENWMNPPQKSSVFEIQALFNEYFSKFRIPFTLELSYESEYFEVAMLYRHQNETLAQLGNLKPAILKAFDLKQPVFYGFLEWDQVLPWIVQAHYAYEPVPRFPSIRRDVSLFLPPNLSYQALEQAIHKANPHLIKKINLFDIYEDKKNGLKSYAISILFWDENKTLTDDTIDKIMQKVFQNLESIEGVTIRK